MMYDTQQSDGAVLARWRTRGREPAAWSEGPQPRNPQRTGTVRRRVGGRCHPGADTAVRGAEAGREVNRACITSRRSAAGGVSPRSMRPRAWTGWRGVSTGTDWKSDCPVRPRAEGSVPCGVWRFPSRTGEYGRSVLSRWRTKSFRPPEHLRIGRLRRTGSGRSAHDALDALAYAVERQGQLDRGGGHPRVLRHQRLMSFLEMRGISGSAPCEEVAQRRRHGRGRVVGGRLVLVYLQVAGGRAPYIVRYADRRMIGAVHGGGTGLHPGSRQAQRAQRPLVSAGRRPQSGCAGEPPVADEARLHYVPLASVPNDATLRRSGEVPA